MIMHYLLLVTFNRGDARSSKQAREHVYRELVNDLSFVCGFPEGTRRFSHAICDWFVIGGRWSGELTKAHLDQAKLRQLEQAFGQQYGWFTSRAVSEDQRREQYREMFLEVFPDFKGKVVPAWRDPYREDGYADDAMLVDQTLYDALLKCYQGQSQGYTKHTYEEYTWRDLHFVDLDDDPVSPAFIGTKWLVVVDYHS